MADNESGRARHRSPNYPAVSLGDAADKVNTLYMRDGKAGSSKESAALHLGYDKLHSLASKILSALKKFGLVEYQGNRVLITQAGLDVVVRPPDDPKRVAALREAVQAPVIYKELINQFASTGLPSDASLKSELLAEKGFNANAVDGFIKDFRQSLEYAGIDNLMVLDSEQEEPADTEGQDTPVVEQQPHRNAPYAPTPPQQPASGQDYPIPLGLSDGKLIYAVVRFPGGITRDAIEGVRDGLRQLEKHVAPKPGNDEDSE